MIGMSRRNVMTFLGLTTSSAALATDDMLARSPDRAHIGGPQNMVVDWAGGKRAADALRRLAAGIESGEVNVTSLNVNSTIEPDDWLSQILTLKFELLEPKA